MASDARLRLSSADPPKQRTCVKEAAATNWSPRLTTAEGSRLRYAVMPAGVSSSPSASRRSAQYFLSRSAVSRSGSFVC